ncbi:SAM-dependent methyltransferase [Streptomyces cyaneofuscatus]|uniref:SAM-dependent methyltransferase n=1 Tax=Streptomyces cyaneofuscatus TaxID=66883 RepID=UPI003822F28A
MTYVELLTEPRLDDAYYQSANASRVYGWYLGDSQNYPPDREAARASLAVAPWVQQAARINRAFQRNSYTWARDMGVRQFLDLGCGWPHHPVLYDVLERELPVVYVDHDPGVAAHLAAELDQGDATTVIRADIMPMGSFLSSAPMLGAIDLDNPVAVFLGDVLSWWPDDTVAQQAMNELRAWMPAGSILAITHLTGDFTPEAVAALVDTYAEYGLTVRPRSRQEIESLFGDFVHQGPGLCATGQWHQASPEARRPREHSAAFAAIAVKSPAQGRDA